MLFAVRMVSGILGEYKMQRSVFSMFPWLIHVVIFADPRVLNFDIINLCKRFGCVHRSNREVMVNPYFENKIINGRIINGK